MIMRDLCIPFYFFSCVTLSYSHCTDYKWVEIIHIFICIYSTAEGIVCYQNVPYCLTEITIGLF